jgi:2-keto-4-pentenoate hydratase/2-oxohepta-3-ene-1,7-dioic acid hydratase in catechol pathway
MKLVTFSSGRLPSGGGERLGVLQDDERVVDVAASARRRSESGDPAFASMQALVEGGAPALTALRALLAEPAQLVLTPLAAVRLLAPLPRPEQIRDCLCFEEHLTNLMARTEAASGSVSAAQLAMHATFKERPIYYKANRFAVVGPDSDVSWPAYSKLMDYELELAAVIGKRGKNLRPEAVREHIFGFTIFNDLSARDQQMLEMPGMLGPSKSKDFDGANVLGPCIVTADEFDETRAGMRVRVNGDLRSEGSSASMSLSFADLIAYISRDETLHPGEIICSGTVGKGCGFEIGKFMQHGDVVELVIDGIGVLRTRVLLPG